MNYPYDLLTATALLIVVITSVILLALN